MYPFQYLMYLNVRVQMCAYVGLDMSMNVSMDESMNVSVYACVHEFVKCESPVQGCEDS